jgi:hypothetical protein
LRLRDYTLFRVMLTAIIVDGIGMLADAIAFAFSFDWIKAKLSPIAALGSVRLANLTGISDLAWFAGLVWPALPR